MNRWLLVPFLILGLLLGGCSSRQSTVPPSEEATAPRPESVTTAEVPREAIPESRWRDMRRISSQGLLQAAKVVGCIALVGGALFLLAAVAASSISKKIT